MSPALNYKVHSNWSLATYPFFSSSKLLLYATSTHLPSPRADQCPIHAPSTCTWAWIRAPATHFSGARILTTLTLSTPPAAFSALPQHLTSPFSVIVLSSQYLFQRGPIWVQLQKQQSTGKEYHSQRHGSLANGG